MAETLDEFPGWISPRRRFRENDAVPLLPDSLSCSSPTKARWSGRGTEHCGYCLPCLIRRAAIRYGLTGADPTSYTVPDLKARVLDTREAVGQQVRSFQFTIRRIKQRP